jgi:hypothetical protein
MTFLENIKVFYFFLFESAFPSAEREKNKAQKNKA